ncbi:hypothetical protein J3F83DRAFT_730720 [Trichoderma novae-zelandiae]
MLFKTTFLFPALLAIGLASAAPGPEIEDNLAARGPEVEEDLAARAPKPNCGNDAFYSQQSHRCICRRQGQEYHQNGRFCSCPRDQFYSNNRCRCRGDQFYDGNRCRCRGDQFYDN